MRSAEILSRSSNYSTRQAIISRPNARISAHRRCLLSDLFSAASSALLFPLSSSRLLSLAAASGSIAALSSSLRCPATPCRRPSSSRTTSSRPHRARRRSFPPCLSSHRSSHALDLATSAPSAARGGSSVFRVFSCQPRWHRAPGFLANSARSRSSRPFLLRWF